MISQKYGSGITVTLGPGNQELIPVIDDIYLCAVSFTSKLRHRWRLHCNDKITHCLHGGIQGFGVGVEGGNREGNDMSTNQIAKQTMGLSVATGGDTRAQYAPLVKPEVSRPPQIFYLSTSTN